MSPVRSLADSLVQDGRNRVEICDVKKWRKYSKIIRIRVQLVLYSARFTAFLFVSHNVFFIFFVLRRFQPAQATRESSR